MEKAWIDYLRVTATIAVVVLHTSVVTFNQYQSINMSDWWFANILNAISRFCVPIFIMISGCLLLGRDMTWQDFYRKRGIRLLPAMLFWNFFYLAYNAIKNDMTLLDTGKAALRIFFSGQAHYHLWYLSMLCCLILIVPFLNIMVTGRRLTVSDYYLLGFIVIMFMIINQISMTTQMWLGRSIQWYKSFPWYLGYFLMGYAIDRFSQHIHVRSRIILLIFFCVLLIGLSGNYVSVEYSEIISDTAVLSNTGVFVFIMSICVFILFRRSADHLPRQAWVHHIAVHSFGIYLIHPIFLDGVRWSLRSAHLSGMFSMLLTSVLVFLLSWLATAIMLRQPWLKNVC